VTLNERPRVLMGKVTLSTLPGTQHPGPDVEMAFMMADAILWGKAGILTGRKAPSPASATKRDELAARPVGKRSAFPTGTKRGPGLA
jgi:hypothetical protein